MKLKEINNNTAVHCKTEEEMSAVEVLKIYGELCYFIKEDCTNCPLDKDNTECGQSFCKVDSIADNAEEIVEICQKWKAEHEKKEPEVEFKYQVVTWNRDDIDPIDKRIYFDTQDEADEKMKELVKMYPDAEFTSQRVCRVKGAK